MMRPRVFLLVAFFLTVGCMDGRASPFTGVFSQWYPPDARSQGLGRAYTAIAEGPAAVWWNPAGLGLAEGVSASPYANFPIAPAREGLELDSYEISLSRKGRGIGAHLSRFDYQETEFIDEMGRPIGRFTPHEYVGIFGAGIDLNRRVIHGSPALALGVGASLKLFHAEWGPARLTLDHQDYDGTSWDFDLGTLVSYRRALRVPEIASGARGPFVELRGGAAIHNVFARSISFVDDEDDSDALGRVLRAGAAIRASLFDLPPFDYLLGATLSAERNWVLDPYSAKPGSFYGAEITFLGLVSARHGWVRDDDGQVHDTITGYGMGFDLAVRGDRRVGLRYDVADVPSANRLWRTDSQTFSIWTTW